MELVVVGHLSRDLIVTPSYRRECLGGGSAYAMLAPAIGATDSGIISKVGTDFEPEYISTLIESGLNLSGLTGGGRYSTRFVNEYDPEGRRIQRVEHIAPPITPRDFTQEHLSSRTIHFCPLTRIETDPRCFQKASENGATVSLDVQGFVRRLRGDKVIQSEWKHADRILKYVDIVKADKEELRAATRTKTTASGIERFLALGVDIVVLTKDRGGSTLYTKDESIKIPLVLAEQVVDTTGSGDTYMIGFLLEYGRSKNLWRSGVFAATCASFNLETVGPYGMPSRAQVEDRMQSYL